MPDNNTVLYQVLKHVPEARFKELVKTHRSDEAGRGLDSKTQLVALLYGQLSGAPGLRAIVTELESPEERLSELGCDPVRRSTLSDANRYRPAALFGDLLGAVLDQVHRGLRRHLDGATYLIDSTSVRLSALSERWARFSATACGAKAHIVYDPDADRPIHAVVTPARVSDLTAAKAMPITAGATYVFDLGYYDYGWWADLHAADCRFVTRFKTNTRLTVEEERAVPPASAEGGVILSDRVGRLPERQASRRKNPFQAKVREVRVRIETGTVLRILSNDLKARPGDRRFLQTSLGDRAVLPLGQADPEDPPFRRQQRERRAHPDRRGADRLRAVASRPGHPVRHRQPAHLRPSRPRQPDAPPPHRSVAPTGSATEKATGAKRQFPLIP